MDMSPASNFRQAIGATPEIELRDTAPCGRAVLWLAMLRRMDLRGIVDRMLPTESEVSHGEVVETLVLNRLTSPRPLYRIAEWATQLGLATLTGRDPARMNDDRIGRTLDALSPIVADVQATLTMHVVQAFDVATADVNYDTSTLYFEGYHEDSELAARGHSKDAKDDHKQVKLALATSEDGQIPLTHITLPGNTGDVTTVPAVLVELRRQLTTQPVVMSGDAAMWSQQNMDAVAHAGGIFLGPIAMIPAVQTWVRATVLTTEVNVQLTRMHKPIVYRAAVASRFAVDGVENGAARIVVYDERRAAEQLEDRRDALERYDAALTALNARLNKRKLKTREAIGTAIAALGARNGLAVKYVRVDVEHGEGGFVLRWYRDADKIIGERGRDGRWPLVTNKSGLNDVELCEWAIRRYKLHGQIERDMHLIKGPIRARPIFVQNDERIRALVAISVWALTALTLLERAGHSALPPQHKNRVPVIARIESLFAAVAIVTLQVGEEDGVRRAISPVRRESQPIVRALGISREVHAVLEEARRVAAPS